MSYTGKNLTPTQLYEQIVAGTPVGETFTVTQRLAVDRAVIARLLQSERFILVTYWSTEVQLKRIA